MNVVRKGDELQANNSPAKAWLRALELTAPIPRNRTRVLLTVIEEVALRMGDAPALLSDSETLTYRALVKRAHQYAHWAINQGLNKGDVVCLLMPNRPEYFAIWLGITSVGVVVSLLNTNLVGSSLAHSISIAAPRHIITSSEFAHTLTASLAQLEHSPSVWSHGDAGSVYPRIDCEIEGYSNESPHCDESHTPTIDDRALLIYTSGTTGMPKAANVSHARVMQWSHWFAGMMNVQPADRMYNCLPMYHSVGGVQVPGAMLVAGGSVVLREKFSASRFWDDIARWECTLFQYIGELCRYVLNSEHSVNESQHHIRLACGNGLSPALWDAFKDRFGIPQILEFYAATEGSVSLFNIQGKSGAIGHIPPYLSHRFSPALVLVDTEIGQPIRDNRGFCVACSANEVGEALGKVSNDTSALASRFEGYTSREASEKKILRNVFEASDAWFRTGDLMRKDEKGFYYFVDRIGDTFRRKGENVATTEVAEVICGFPGVQHANVYGVEVPGVEGRVGMAMVVTDTQPDLAKFHEHLGTCLPGYARPVFIRVRAEADLTGTFKYSKAVLLREAYDPGACSDQIYFDNSTKFVAVDQDLYSRIQRGELRI